MQLNSIKQDTADLSLSQKFDYFLTHFNRNKVYDLANNTDFPGASEAFGNWFYGAAMNVTGFSNASARRFAAAVQPVQNLTGDEDFLTKLAARTQAVFNFTTNTGDGLNDAENINKGSAYADMFANDIASGQPGDSCNSSSTPTVTCGSGGFGSWIGRVFVPGASWGFFYSTTYNTSITDLPNNSGPGNGDPEVDPD
ncbi:hypothetical protein CWE08_01435 [Aliidiomarina iranensis]|uniref:Uncharacterized protein n=2 Tax=Aliidiomarina iranensis TaxID=1434071 RepID=A0A432W292_9GAMM|nr:hypothetical protein CWE08_01435 [Aliidiomarina iranensis]